MWHLARQAAVIESESLHDLKAKAAILSAFIGEEEGNVLNQLTRSLGMMDGIRSSTPAAFLNGAESRRTNETALPVPKKLRPAPEWKGRPLVANPGLWAEGVTGIAKLVLGAAPQAAPWFQCPAACFDSFLRKSTSARSLTGTWRRLE
jgi:hypothetical protein